MSINPALGKSRLPETIGKRIARLRQEQGWTQQTLAARLAISRVAVSHIEMDLTTPGERTITLMAGILKLTPHDLVEGTTYPLAKSERLPEVTCSFTRLELELALLENDLAWIERITGQPEFEPLCLDIYKKWALSLGQWAEQSIDERDRQSNSAAREKLAAITSYP